MKSSHFWKITLQPKITIMNIVKAIIKQVWPIIHQVLAKAAEKTTTPFDDIAVAGIDASIEEWLEDTDDDIVIS